MKTEYNIATKWIAFPLHPETPEEGQALEEMFAGRGFDLPAAMAHLRQVAAGLGLPFGDRNMTYNSRKAQELGKWAEDKGAGDAFHHAMFNAYFVDGENIADTSVLSRIAESLGLNPDEARTVLKDRRYREAVDRDWEYSRGSGISAVPTFASGGRLVVGAQPYETLEKLVTSAGANRKPA